MKEYKYEVKYGIDNDTQDTVRHYDERQLAYRQKGTIIALWVFSGAVVANTFIMDVFYQWASYLSSVWIFASVAFLVFNLYNASKSALLSVNLGIKKERSSAITTLIFIVANLCIWLNDFNWVMIDNGRITKGLTVIIVGIFLLCSFGVNLYMVKKALAPEKPDTEQ